MLVRALMIYEQKLGVSHPATALSLSNLAILYYKQQKYEEAESLYAGDFLEEDAYEDWAVALREEARAVYICTVRELADRALADGEFEGAARYLRRILERDPYDEDAHLKLVTGLQSAGQHGEARRAYQTYVGRLESIGLEPAPHPTAARTRQP